jgi:hypothetical protein
VDDAGGSRHDAGEEPDGASTSGADAGSDTPSDPCVGFKVEGLKYSPGGKVLPNTCKPFDVNTNNPYAIRCVDAWPWYATRFPGDALCILPPPPDKGIQVGVHPQGSAWHAQMLKHDLSGYDKPADEWVLHANEEETINYRSGASNPKAHNYYRTYFRMRVGSHHNIITMHQAGAEREVWLPGADLPGLFDTTSGTLISVLGGQQRPDDSTPTTMDKPVEDKGMYLSWPANPSIVFNMHHFNVTDGDILKETWANVWWEDEDAEVEVTWFMGLELGQVAGLSMQPGDTRDLHYVWDVAKPTRLVRFFGHRHAWTSNFSSWVEHKGGNIDLIYQSYNWNDMPTYRYDSQVKNPVPDPEAKSDGAASGVLTMDAGDRLHFNCHVAFTNERAAIAKAPLPVEIGPLHFANEAFAGEMCIAFGNTSGAPLGLPKVAADPVPDFATSP